MKSRIAAGFAALSLLSSACATTRAPTTGPIDGGIRSVTPDRGTEPTTPHPWATVHQERCALYAPALLAGAESMGIDGALAVGIAKVESGFRPEVRSRSGATGLMQVMPRSGERLKCGPLDEPAANIACALTIYSRFRAHYDGDPILALSAYNAGYRTPNRARASGEDPANMRYINKVLAAKRTYETRGCGGGA